MPNENFSIHELGLKVLSLFSWLTVEGTKNHWICVERKVSTFSLKFTSRNEFAVKNQSCK